jgi:hypothetical protein
VLAELKIVDKWRAADLRGENQTASPPPAIITPLTAERLAGLARLDAGAARPHGGIAGASRPIAPPASVLAQRQGASRASRPIACLGTGAARHRASIEGEDIDRVN